MATLIIGCGYLGLPLAHACKASGQRVLVTSRSPARQRELASQGLECLQLDVTDLKPGVLPDVEVIVFAVGFDRTTEHAIEDVYVEGLRAVLAQVGGRLERFLYVSSTGVYGQTSGEWVDETSPCVPQRTGGKACLAAEQLLRTHPIAGPCAGVLRMAGLYGPGRLPLLARLQAGEPLSAAPDAHLNLIHIEDAVRVMLAATTQLQVPTTLCVSDGHPIKRARFYEELARSQGTPPPTFSAPSSGDARSARSQGDKRVCNDKLMAELGLRLRYPSYREGLAAIA